VTAKFLRKMEHILWLYALPDDLLHPLVCFDEKSIQLLAQTRKVIDCRPGKATRQDYEYKRNGTRNLFMFVAPKRGERNVLVTNRRTKIDFAQAMRYLVDVMYPEAEYINLVMDNLNTHHYHSLVEAFGKIEADRIMSRLRFHFTPAHASWLNMAEVELSQRFIRSMSFATASQMIGHSGIKSQPGRMLIIPVNPKSAGSSPLRMLVRFSNSITLHL
jgi:hypothetical protein